MRVERGFENFLGDRRASRLAKRALSPNFQGVTAQNFFSKKLQKGVAH
jgi:hypothetical protein